MAPQPIAAVLLAAGLDWLEGLLPLLFVVIWVASQVLNLFRGGRRGEAAKPQPNPRGDRRPGPVPRAPQPVRRGAGGEPDGEVALDREIEAFLRRRLERGEQANEAEPTAPPRPRRTAGKPSRRRSRAQAEGLVPPPAPPPLPRSPTLSAAGGDVASHVEHAFAHDLAHASPTSIDGGVPQVAAHPAAALVAALQSPGGLRQLVLMREVLERPTHRW